MISLNKADATASIDLTKQGADNYLTVRALWTDNGDGRDDNDDLDLRAAILLPNGDVHFLDCDNEGSMNASPFAKHMGDIQSASDDDPGEEVIRVNKSIGQNGKIAIVFSVYSAVSNGAVSIASLKPKMEIRFGDEVVECELKKINFSKNSYTYVVGTAIIDQGRVVISPGGMNSPFGSESTPWPTWKGKQVDVDFSGPKVFKGKRNSQSKELFGGFFGKKKRYINIG